MRKRILGILLTLCIVMSIAPVTVFAASSATVDQSAKNEYDKLVRDGVFPDDIPFDNFIDVGEHQKGTDIVIGKEGTYFITGSVTYSGKDPARIRVDDEVVGAVAFFYNCYMDYSQCKVEYSPVTVHAGAYATLHFLGENTFIGAKKRPGIEKNYKKGGGTMTLKLWDDCSVTATGGEFAAGIGSAYEKDGGSILIETNGSKGNGKLIANGTNGVFGKDELDNNIYIGGAGIGGSKDGSAHNITIAGGTIIANGGEESAGIGGGYNGNAEDILISGGTIEATSPGGGAGIGTGSCSSQRAEKENWLLCKNITITGGKVTATGGRMHTAGIGGGAGGKAENISIKGGSVTALVKSTYYGRVIGGGQDCTDISENITASLSSFFDKGKYYNVTLIATNAYAGNVEQIKYRIYPGETFDIQKVVEEWFKTGRKEDEKITLIPGIIFTPVNCNHFEVDTDGGLTYIRLTDYYKNVGEDRVHFCDQCGSVLDYDNTYPELDSEYTKNIVGDWNFKLTDPQPATTEAKAFSYKNPNGNTVDFIVTERASGIFKVLLDGEPLKANNDGSYTVPADSVLPDSINNHTLYFSDRAGHYITQEKIKIFEAVTITAYCDGNPMFINDTGNTEVQMARGGIFKLTDIKNPGYNGYYKVYANGEYFGTVLQTGDLGRFYEDTRLDFYTDKDTKPPTGKIAVAENSWTDYDSEGRPDSMVYINKSEKVTVTAEDEHSGVESVKYRISDSHLSTDQLEKDADWLEYTEPFELPTDKAYYVYAKITDKTGNVIYINSAAIRSTASPVDIVSVSGNPSEWQALSAEIRLTVTGDAPISSALVYIDGGTEGESCSIKGDTVTFSAEKNGSYRVVVTDSAGNTAEKTVEVTRIDLSVPTVTLTADEDTPRKSASVTAAVADCLSGYKLYLSANGMPERELSEKYFTVTENGTYTVRAVNGAGTEYTASVTYTNIDTEAPLISGIEDGKIYCSAVTFGVEDESSIKVTANGEELLPDKDGNYTVSPDGTPTKSLTVTDAAGNTVSLNITVNDGHTWSNWTHVGNTHTRSCTVDGCSGTETENCSGGKADCTDKAICEVCNESYGEKDADNHADLKHIEAKAATEASEGNIEYWYCDGCGKYYKDSAATQEITKEQTVTAKLVKEKPTSPVSPSTGETSHPILWITLLFICGGAITATTVVGKKRKRGR